MGLARLFRHLAMTSLRVRRAFPKSALHAIEQTIRTSETTHAGEVQIVLEGSLDGMPLLRGQTSRERAIELFARLHVWDTEHNTGVLIYVLLADRRVEIVADRGIHAKAGARAWAEICRSMEACFGGGDFAGGAIHGIDAVTQLLSRHFPIQTGDRNELPDTPVVL